MKAGIVENADEYEYSSWAEYEGKVKVGKLNVDDAPETAQKYGIMSIPTLLYIKNGEVVNKSIGVVSKSDIEQVLNNL